MVDMQQWCSNNPTSTGMKESQTQVLHRTPKYSSVLHSTPKYSGVTPEYSSVLRKNSLLLRSTPNTPKYSEVLRSTPGVLEYSKEYSLPSLSLSLESVYFTTIQQRRDFWQSTALGTAQAQKRYCNEHRRNLKWRLRRIGKECECFVIDLPTQLDKQIARVYVVVWKMIKPKSLREDVPYE